MRKQNSMRKKREIRVENRAEQRQHAVSLLQSRHTVTQTDGITGISKGTSVGLNLH